MSFEHASFLKKLTLRPFIGRKQDASLQRRVLNGTRSVPFIRSRPT